MHNDIMIFARFIGVTPLENGRSGAGCQPFIYFPDYCVTIRGIWKKIVLPGLLIGKVLSREAKNLGELRVYVDCVESGRTDGNRNREIFCQIPEDLFILTQPIDRFLIFEFACLQLFYPALKLLIGGFSRHKTTSNYR